MTPPATQDLAAGDLAVRRATEYDLSALVELNAALSREDAGQRDPFMDLAWPRHASHDYFMGAMRDTDSLVVVADDQGTAVGYLVGRLSADSMRTVTTAILESMCVHEGRRGTGVGSGLVESFLQWARERRAGCVEVTAYAANEGALRFYQRFGLQTRRVTLDMALAQ